MMRFFSLCTTISYCYVVTEHCMVVIHQVDITFYSSLSVIAADIKRKFIKCLLVWGGHEFRHKSEIDTHV